MAKRKPAASSLKLGRFGVRNTLNSSEKESVIDRLARSPPAYSRLSYSSFAVLTMRQFGGGA